MLVLSPGQIACAMVCPSQKLLLLSLSLTSLLTNLMSIISHFLEPSSYLADYFQLVFLIADSELLN